MRTERSSCAENLQAVLECSIGRRSLLRGSAAGAALLAAGALLSSAGCRAYPAPPVPLRFFTAQEYAVFGAIAKAVLGLGEGDTVDVAAEVDRLVAGMDRSVRRDLRWILRIFEHGTHFFDLQAGRFTRLDRADQEAYLVGWMQSSLGARRLVFRALKLMSALGYYGVAVTWSGIGYAGPWLGRKDAKPLREPEPAVALDAVAPKLVSPVSRKDSRTEAASKLGMRPSGFVATS